MSSSKIDILHINESKLDSTVSDDEVYICGFEIVRKDREINGTDGGGVFTYVRTNLSYRIRNDLNNDNLECQFVEISKPRSTPSLSVLGIDPQVLHLIYLANLRILLLKLTRKIRNYIYSVT